MKTLKTNYDKIFGYTFTDYSKNFKVNEKNVIKNKSELNNYDKIFGYTFTFYNKKIT